MILTTQQHHQEQHYIQTMYPGDTLLFNCSRSLANVKCSHLEFQHSLKGEWKEEKSLSHNSVNVLMAVSVPWLCTWLNVYLNRRKPFSVLLQNIPVEKCVSIFGVLKKCFPCVDQAALFPLVTDGHWLRTYWMCGAARQSLALKEFRLHILPFVIFSKISPSKCTLHIGLSGLSSQSWATGWPTGEKRNQRGKLHFQAILHLSKECRRLHSLFPYFPN